MSAVNFTETSSLLEQPLRRDPEMKAIKYGAIREVDYRDTIYVSSHKVDNL